VIAPSVVAGRMVTEYWSSQQLATNVSMRILRNISILLLSLALIAICAACSTIWAEHQRIVADRRLAFGPNAEMPSFSLLHFVTADTMPLLACDFYILASGLAILGILGLVLSRPSSACSSTLQSPSCVPTERKSDTSK
jgi:hypothetical protein